MQRRIASLLVLALAGVGLSTAAAARRAAAPDARPAPTSRGFRLPIAFEANRGQTDSRVRYLARGAQSTLFITPSEAVLALPGLHDAKSERVPVLRMRLKGAAARPVTTAERRLPGVTNYLRGQDATRWLTHVPTFGQVTWRGVYPGTDVAFHGDHGQLEYDFILAPGADPSRIRLEMAGADSARILPNGELVVQVGGREVRQRCPRIYQESAAGSRRDVDGGFRILSPAARGQRLCVGFRLASHDPSQRLVIDPVLDFSTFLGGSAPDLAQRVVVNPDGDIFVGGSTSSLDFPTSGTAFRRNWEHTFVARIAPGGESLRYSTFLAGSAGGTVSGLALVSLNEVCVVGSSVIDLPIKGGFQSTTMPRNTGFLAVLSQDGSSLRYSTYLCGTEQSLEGTFATAVTADLDGNIYVAGSSDQPGLPTTQGAYRRTITGGSGDVDAFLMKVRWTAVGIDSLLYCTYLGGTRADWCLAIGRDASGRIYLAGNTYSGDFPTTPGAYEPDHEAGEFSHSAGFVTRLSADLQSLDYSTYFGNDGRTVCEALSVTETGAVWLAGSATGALPTTADALQQGPQGAADGFLARLDPAGARVPYCSYLGGTAGDGVTALARDTAGGLYVCLNCENNDFPRTVTMPGDGAFGTFLVRLDDDATNLLYSLYFPGIRGWDVAADRQHGACLVGDASEAFTQVQPLWAFGGGNDAGIALLSVDTVNPPAGLSVDALYGHRVRLVWEDTNDNEIGYKIQRRTAGADFVTLARTATDATSYDDTTTVPETTYWFRVRAVGSEDVSAPVEVEVTTPALPADPSDLEAEAIAGTQIRLRWSDNSTSESDFAIERKTGAEPFREVASAGANSVIFTDDGLIVHTTYTYRIRARNGDDVSGYSNLASATTLDLPDADPTDLEAAALSATAVSLEWRERSTNETGFSIERRQGAAEFAVVGTTGPNTEAFTDTGLAPNTLYGWRVRASGTDGDSGPSNEATARTRPAAPEDLAARAVSTTEIALSFRDANPTAVAHRLERSDDGGLHFREIQRLQPGIRSHADRGLLPGQSYHYRARAENSSGTSVYSDTVSAATLEIPPSPPRQLQALATSARRIALTWTAGDTTEDGFRIERRLGTNDFGALATTAAGVTRYDDATVEPSRTYTYRVLAFNTGGTSRFSEPAAATTPAEVGGSLRAPANLAFGRVRRRTVVVKTLRLANGSRAQALRVSLAQIKAPFALLSARGPFVIDPGVSVTLRIRFQSSRKGKFRAPLRLTTSDPRHPSFVVTLTARAR
jgi:chitodextrinase